MTQNIIGLEEAAKSLVPKNTSAHDKTIRRFVAVIACLQTACQKLTEMEAAYQEFNAPAKLPRLTEIRKWAQQNSQYWNGILSRREVVRREAK